MIETFFKAFAIALVEGLTEFVPVSSTGHMILLGDLIQFTGEKAHSFEVFIQLGAILAALLIYKDKFIGLLPQKGENPIKSLLWGGSKPTGLHIFVAIFPIMLGGLLFHKTIKTVLFSSQTVAIGLMVGGFLMVLIELLPFKQTVEEVEGISLKQAIGIGLGQCLALWPGLSRSGSTMLTSLALGIKHKAAADFSFIIAVPVMCAAVGYDMLKSWHFLSLSDLPLFLFGFVIAFVVAYGSILWFLKVLNQIGLVPFGIYRMAVGAFVYFMVV